MLGFSINVFVSIFYKWYNIQNILTFFKILIKTFYLHLIYFYIYINVDKKCFVLSTYLKLNKNFLKFEVVVYVLYV